MYATVENAITAVKIAVKTTGSGHQLILFYLQGGLARSLCPKRNLVKALDKPLNMP
jgi:hypothetical protein